ncbi:helix-turn-helix domain-containing protein [Thiocystis violascens]|uniref:Putative transcriptional regulator n=1 Tax=Thiocystis violascens (strain ATCC 17096 / DSM 198 / 6111) TaxID=765911 RepID=I3YD28_THIV6|nr:helix-turn-helix domain-containing protein [Thiocystis violascens]AFL74896.1 putative transcriptional regulator [Thiocystis violascens DSM 198]
MTERDIGQEILDGIREIKAHQRGEVTLRTLEVADPDARAIRQRMGLTQDAFAALLGVSPRTLEGWEQGRRQPRGSALALLRVAANHPEALRP